jgi:DNA ligase-1
VEDWKGVTFNVFDAPTRNDLKYEERIEEIKKHLPSDHITTRLIPTVICQGKDHLFHIFYEVLQKGGEGVILRKPKCFYNERNTFLKVKVRKK